MNDANVSPVSPVVPEQQNSTNNTPTGQKVSLNPFSHLSVGVKAFFKTNISPGLAAILISSAVNAVFSLGFLYAVTVVGFAFMPGLAVGGNDSSLFKALGVFIVLAILGSFILGYFSSVISRLIITGARGQKESLGAAFSFVFHRLSNIVLTYLLVIAIFVGGAFVIGALGSISPILAALFSLVAFIAAIIFALRISYIPLILVDNEDPGQPLTVLKRSSALWNKSGWALVLYVITLLVIYVIIGMFTGDSTSPASVYGGSPSGISFPGLFSAAIVAALVSSLISNVFGALVYCGEASIYNDARQLVDGPTPAAASAAPQAPTA